MQVLERQHQGLNLCARHRPNEADLAPSRVHPEAGPSAGIAALGRRGAADRYCSSQSRINGFFCPGVAAGLPCASNPVFAMVSCGVGSAVEASDATGPVGGALNAPGGGSIPVVAPGGGRVDTFEATGPGGGALKAAGAG
jgi:hypothetical protein